MTQEASAGGGYPAWPVWRGRMADIGKIRRGPDRQGLAGRGLSRSRTLCRCLCYQSSVTTPYFCIRAQNGAGLPAQPTQAVGLPECLPEFDLMLLCLI
jgi:hypothetical protein